MSIKKVSTVLLIIVIIILLVIGLLEFWHPYQETFSDTIQTNEKDQNAFLIEFREYTFVGFINETVALRKDDYIYTYDRSQKTLTALFKCELEEKVTSSGQYFFSFSTNFSSSPREIYNYNGNLKVRDAQGNIIAQSNELFSELGVQDNLVIFIRYREIESFDDNISEIKEYCIEEASFVQIREYFLPLEVAYLHDNIFTSIYPRVPTGYKIGSALEIESIEYFGLLIASNKEMCDLMLQEGTLTCQGEISTIASQTWVAGYYDGSILWGLEDTEVEYPSFETDETGKIITLKLINPYATYLFICEKDICIIGNEEGTIIIEKTL